MTKREMIVRIFSELEGEVPESTVKKVVDTFERCLREHFVGSCEMVPSYVIQRVCTLKIEKSKRKFRYDRKAKGVVEYPMPRRVLRSVVSKTLPSELND